MNNVDKQYLDLLQNILDKGVKKADRTGTGTISTFGQTLRFNMQDGFPLLTTKKIHTKSVIHELLWFLKGDTNIKYLKENGVTIWDEWANEKGELGPVYGSQWVKWPKIKLDPTENPTEYYPEVTYINQIQNAIDRLKNKPDDRRIMVSAWNVAEIDNMKLPPCHYSFQLWTRELTTEERMKFIKPEDFKQGQTISDWTMNEVNIPKRAVSMIFNMRSIDTLLGLPFNIASYAFLLHMMAQCANMMPEDLVFNGGDTHIYLNHLEQVKEQLTRTPYELPTLRLNPEVTDIFNFKYEDFKIENYQCHPAIKAPIAV